MKKSEEKVKENFKKGIIMRKRKNEKNEKKKMKKRKKMRKNEEK